MTVQGTQELCAMMQLQEWLHPDTHSVPFLSINVVLEDGVSLGKPESKGKGQGTWKGVWCMA